MEVVNCLDRGEQRSEVRGLEEHLDHFERFVSFNTSFFFLFHLQLNEPECFDRYLCTKVENQSDKVVEERMKHWSLPPCSAPATLNTERCNPTVCILSYTEAVFPSWLSSFTAFWFISLGFLAGGIAVYPCWGRRASFDL